ncbi:type II toxin-antitoxin system VapC family toxin [Candidatus Gottesmanbacteria bacterium]|nr:type II toxin-antitoxin system VapC family toxin [Candidatus Gottesmanbacteria bacterium]MBI5452839.1 type II toxin-antitoxin system VapC family toxin [Candidatus Gottesmanbacteria bacterium]
MKKKLAVFDTSVAIKWFFPENGKDQALVLREKHVNGEITLATRDLFLYEFTSALKNYSDPKIAEKDFLLAQKAIESLRITLFPLEYGELSELFSLSRNLDISIYDSSYILLAQKLSSSLYTGDKKLYLAGKKTVKAFLI